MTGRARQSVQLGEPVRDPEPATGCDVCEALAQQRVAAYAVGNRSKVSDCNVEIRRHPHRK
ncbi:hypothetical protein OJ254_05235 [Streptomyces endophytica]|uniref:Uncharacterized protein n=1 Tax=Streptomyces endophytica TaxID=2991496 RepID=A0ABY6P8K9_9ACTN|nr:hypothetical protein [Streptomyces endophytica]UZJ29942.1 hypothetical protein OJ254_05235 [Streptomyces endophytica]